MKVLILLSMASMALAGGEPDYPIAPINKGDTPEIAQYKIDFSKTFEQARQGQGPALKFTEPTAAVRMLTQEHLMAVEQAKQGLHANLAPKPVPNVYIAEAEDVMRAREEHEKAKMAFEALSKIAPAENAVVVEALPQPTIKAAENTVIVEPMETKAEEQKKIASLRYTVPTFVPIGSPAYISSVPTFRVASTIPTISTGIPTVTVNSNVATLKTNLPVVKTISTGVPVVKTISTGVPVVKTISTGVPVVKTISTGFPTIPYPYTAQTGYVKVFKTAEKED